MGADLYIRDMDKTKQITGFEVSWKAVKSGYFRDCYNDWGLFNFFRSNTGKEYSWWQFQKNKEWFAKLKDADGDEEDMMTPKGAELFLKIIDDARHIIEKKKKLIMLIVNFEETELLRKAGKIKDVAEWVRTEKVLTKKEAKEYKDWMYMLIMFLQLAIELQSPIIWSV